jgi:hypothetical protein
MDGRNVCVCIHTILRENASKNITVILYSNLIKTHKEMAAPHNLLTLNLIYHEKILHNVHLDNDDEYSSKAKIGQHRSTA